MDLVLFTTKTDKRGLTTLSSFVSETRPNACKECGSSRGAMGSNGPSFGIFILMRRCQLYQNKDEKTKS